ncbi:hypothetical protein EVAR_101946_1 [Eumeta japonica]|uniref:Uncharacterized protein n=1 Tax=Eumeta variegata TaxID=151549 RepID=A0A4C1TSD3_EUMVA|nr:hypothetical protein EVAR_101946_1 [Eumeta japonica]
MRRSGTGLKVRSDLKPKMVLALESLSRAWPVALSVMTDIFFTPYIPACSLNLGNLSLAEFRCVPDLEAHLSVECRRKKDGQHHHHRATIISRWQLQDEYKPLSQEDY